MLLYQSEGGIEIPEDFAVWLASFAALSREEQAERLRPVRAEMRAVAELRRAHYAALIEDLDRP